MPHLFCVWGRGGVLGHHGLHTLLCHANAVNHFEAFFMKNADVASDEREPPWSTLASADASLVNDLPHPRAYYLLGRALHRSDDQAERNSAIYALNMAHKLHPLAAAYTELGVVLSREDRASEAEKTLRKAVQFTPRESVAYLALGTLIAKKHEASHSAEAVALLRQAVALDPRHGSAYISLAASLQSSGDLSSAQTAASWAARLSPSDPRLRADWRHWQVNWASRQQSDRGSGDGRSSDGSGNDGSSSGSGDDSGGGILYEANLQYPWSGAALRWMASRHADAAEARRRRGALSVNASAAAWRRAGDFTPLRVAYIGSLSDEPQMRAMASLFRGADPSVAGLAVHPVTGKPKGSPDYLRFFLASLPEAALRPGPPAVGSAEALSRQIGASGAHILLDGLWRKECAREAR